MNSCDNAYPLVSAVVPAFNSGTWIGGALESVLAQDYPNLEIIVVNDASTDATEDVARSKLEGRGRPFSLITHKENRGVSAVRNTGLAAAKGEFVWFCGFKNRFENDHPDAPVPVNLEGAAIRKGEDLVWLRALNKIAPHICGMLFRKSFLLETGLRFQEGCTNGEDVEFQLKALCRARQAAFTPDCLYIYVQHAGMGSVRDNDSKEKQLRRYRDNTGAYEDLLSEGATRNTLSASKEYLFQKPEVYMKAFALLYFPDIYYRLRRR